jgi:hypothetical protein
VRPSPGRSDLTEEGISARGVGRVLRAHAAHLRWRSKPLTSPPPCQKCSSTASMSVPTTEPRSEEDSRLQLGYSAIIKNGASLGTIGSIEKPSGVDGLRNRCIITQD